MFLVAHQKSIGKILYLNPQKLDKPIKKEKEKDKDKEKKDKTILFQNKQKKILENSNNPKNENLNLINNNLSNKSTNLSNQTTSETQTIIINNNSNPSNFSNKSTTGDSLNSAPVQKTIKLKLSVIRAPHAPNFISSNSASNVGNNLNINSKPNTIGSQNSILKNENNSNIIMSNILNRANKNIFTTSPFVTFNTNNSLNNNSNAINTNLKSAVSTNLNIPILNSAKFISPQDGIKNQKNSLKNGNNFNQNNINNNTFNTNHNNNLHNSHKNANNNNTNKTCSEAKNINININNINSGAASSAQTNSEKNLSFSPNDNNNNSNKASNNTFSTTNNILISTNNINNSTTCNSTNNINININNNFSGGTNTNSIININNFCSGTSNKNSLINNSCENNSNNNLINNNNSNSQNANNQNLITLSNFNTSLFQSLAAIDYKDPEKKKIKKRLKEMRIKHKRLHREGTYNCGRWQPEEHERFIEAIMKFGNEWKQVQKYVGTRSSTQARSHAQKFFVKIKRANILDFNIDLSKNSIKNLHEMANNLNSDQYVNAIKALNCVAFERKANSSKRKHKKDDQNVFESNLNMSDDCDAKMNLINEDMQANLGDNNFIFGNSDKNLFNKVKSFLGTQLNNNSNIKIYQGNEYDEIRKASINIDFKTENNNINNLILNNINNKNSQINKANNNFNFSKFDQTMLRKRTRLSSFEGFWNFDRENFGNNHKKSIDEIELLNTFGKEIKYDFHEEEFEQLDDCLKNTSFAIGFETNKSRKKSFKNKFGDIDFCVGATLINNNLSGIGNPLFSNNINTNITNQKSKPEIKDQNKDDDDIFLKFLV